MMYLVLQPEIAYLKDENTLTVYPVPPHHLYLAAYHIFDHKPDFDEVTEILYAHLTEVQC